VVTAVYSLSVAGLAFVVELISDVRIEFADHPWLTGPAFALWWLVYYAYSWSISGHTLGMALLGLRVVAADGAEVRPRAALLRALTLPLSFMLLGLGFLGILWRSDRRALHDRLAGTAVVYGWDARAAHLRFLARRAGQPGG
jgi:uncharacterized RDD family membrane protein YckC